MAKRRRGKDWEGIVRNVVALCILGAVFFGLNTQVGVGKANPSSSPLSVLFALITMAVTILIILAAVFGVACIIWKIACARMRPKKANVVSVSEPPRDEDALSRSLNITDRLEMLDWFQLEKLVLALFEASGYRAEHRGGAKPDGGIDLMVENADGRIAVQCKHWGKWKCGISVVRELMGSMLHDGIPQGYLIATEITPDARELAAKHSIGIMDREELTRWIQGALAADNSAVRDALEHPEKLCPKCGAKMIRRTAKKGKNAGASFWGCSRYPKCSQIMNE